VVKFSTHNTKIEASNPPTVTETERERERERKREGERERERERDKKVNTTLVRMCRL
jgi:hypothetical protein